MRLDTIIFPIVRMIELKYRKAKWLTQGHTARNVRIRILTQSVWLPHPIWLPRPMLCCFSDLQCHEGLINACHMEELSAQMHEGNILVHAGSNGAMDGSSHLVFLIMGPWLREVTLLDRRNNTSDPTSSWDHHVTRESLNILFLNSYRVWAIFTAFRIW